MTDSSASEWFHDWEINGSIVEIRLIEDLLSSTPVEVWVIDLDLSDGNDRLDFATAGELIESVRAADGHRVAPNFTVDFQRSYTSWGADGAAETMLMQIAAAALGIGVNAAVGNALYDALKSAAVRILRRAQAKHDWPPRPSLTQEEARQLARWHVIRKFDLEAEGSAGDPPSLTLAGEEERADGSRLVRFRDGDKRYEVELVDDAGLVVIGRIGWTSD